MGCNSTIFPPNVLISSVEPANTGNTVVVSGTAFDNILVERIELYLNNVQISTTTDVRPDAQFEFHVDIDLLNAGINVFVVRAHDYAGNYAIRSSLSVGRDATPFYNATQQRGWQRIRRPAYGSDSATFYHESYETIQQTQALEYETNVYNLTILANSGDFNHVDIYRDMLMANETSLYFEYLPARGYDFWLMLDSSMGNFDLHVVDPLGRVFSSDQFGVISCNDTIELSELSLNQLSTSDEYLNMRVVSLGHQGIMVENPILGLWHFSVTSLNESDNMTFAVGIAERPQPPLITNVDEISILQNGNDAIVQGIASTHGVVDWSLIDFNANVLADGHFNIEAGESFVVSLPNMPNGRYQFAIKTDGSSGFSSDTVIIDIVVSDISPEIFVDEMLEWLYFGDIMTLTARADNAIFAWVELDGVVVDMFVLPAGEEDGISAIALFGNLELNEGVNEVTITAIGSTGLTAERVLRLVSDQTTPDSLRTEPVISYISIEQSSIISEPTTFRVVVDDYNVDDVVLSVSHNHIPINVIDLGEGVFEFTINPALYDIGSRFLSLVAQNRWGNFEQVTRQIFIE